MPLSLDYAKRLVAKLDLPDEAELVLDCPSYWDETPCRLFFERCEELAFHTPQQAVKTAEIAPRLAETVREENNPDGRRKRRELLVRAHTILGSAYRAVGRHYEAEQTFARALRLGRAGIGLEIQALLHRRIAYLRAAQNRLAEAIDFANLAVKISQHPNAVAAAHTARGYVNVKLGRYSDGVRDLGMALSIINPKQDPGMGEAKRIRHSAVHNLAYAISQSPSPESLGDVQFYLRQARKLVPHHRRSLPRYQLYWLEGMSLIKLGSGRRGERLFQRARAGFKEIGAIFELALINLDLSELYRDEERWPELAQLAEETFHIFRKLPADAEAIAALSLWMEAASAQQLENKIILRIKAGLCERMPRHTAVGSAPRG